MVMSEGTLEEIPQIGQMVSTFSRDSVVIRSEVFPGNVLTSKGVESCLTSIKVKGIPAPVSGNLTSL